MLTIRREQMRAFEACLANEFRARLVEHLRQVTPACSDPEQQVEIGLSLAPEFGLERACDVARFIEITVRKLGAFPEPEFPKSALAVLTSYGMDPTRKLNIYEEWVTRHGGAVQ